MADMLHCMESNDMSRRYRDGLLNDFMFGRFDVDREYCLGFLFDSAPRLLGLPRAERLPPALFSSDGRVPAEWALAGTPDEPKSMGVRTRAQMRGSNFAPVGKGAVAAGDVDDADLPDEAVEADVLDIAMDSVDGVHSDAAPGGGTEDAGDLQKKIMTAETVAASHEVAFGEHTGALTRRTDERVRSGLVLVASLINLPTNLGGLSRTSEIFNVGRLVLPDKRFTLQKVRRGMICFEVHTMGVGSE